MHIPFIQDKFYHFSLNNNWDPPEELVNMVAVNRLVGLDVMNSGAEYEHA
jgi:hypothetical protein